MVFRELGAEVFLRGATPDGRNINDDCGSLFPHHTSAEVCQRQAAIGVALDGDADRVTLIDENGQVLDGDEIMAILGTRMLERRTLAHHTVVATVMSNLGLEQALGRKGGTLLRTAVGDRYVVEAMCERGLNFGGEASGHIIFLAHSTTGDGILAALQVLAVMVEEKKPLSELARTMTRYPQVLVNVQVAKKEPLDSMPRVQAAIAGAEAALGADGRVLVRYSGTENKVRVMVEGPDDKSIRAHADEIASVLKQALGGSRIEV
jgi:phosphoglucosamine mutase